MEKQIIINYDKDEDILSLFKKDRKAKFSQEINLPDGDLIVDYSSDGFVAGLEFFNASNYFPKIKKADNIKARMSVRYGKNAVIIFYAILIPQEEPVSKELIISPYNKELILEE
jgi:uncharacterized protein YuzE